MPGLKTRTAGGDYEALETTIDSTEGGDAALDGSVETNVEQEQEQEPEREQELDLTGLGEPEREPQPEVESVVKFDARLEMEGDLELCIARKISAYMQERQQDKGDGEDYAGAMSTIPGLQKHSRSTRRAKIQVKMDDIIDPGSVATEANEMLANSGDTAVPFELFVDGAPLDTHGGKRWKDLAAHIQGDPGSRTLELQAKLASIEQQNVIHMSKMMSKKDGQRELDPNSLSPAGTPNSAVDPLSRTVPVRAAFRLQKLGSVDLEKRQFTASFYLELQWVQQAIGRPRADSSMTPRLSRAASFNEPLQFDPKAYFENQIGETRDNKWNMQQQPCASVEQLQRFWAVDPEAVNVGDYTLARALWNGTASFSIDDQDIYDAPLGTVALKIKIRSDYQTSKVVPQETMSGRLMPTVVPQEGCVSFIKVDMGEQYIDTPLTEMALSCEKGSFQASYKVPTQHKLEQVAAKADKPSVDLCFEYRPRLLPYRVSLLLPSVLIGVVAMASVWFADEEDRALTNAILLVGAVLRISPGRGMETLGSVNLFLCGTVLLVAILSVADLVNTSYADGETVPQNVQIVSGHKIVQLVCFGLWLISAGLLCFTRRSLSCFLRRPATSESKRKPLPKSIIDMTGSLLHTQWRKDRADGFNGKLVPRWKTIKAKESKTWLEQFDEQKREGLKGIVYATAPIPEAHQKHYLGRLQAITDKTRVPDSQSPEDDMAASTSRISPAASETRTYKHNMKLSIREVNDMVVEYMTDHPHDEPTKDVMHICDINNDFSVLPPSWQEDNWEMAREALSLCREHPEWRDDQLSAKVHDFWLERNPWEKDGPLGVDFDELPTIEQAKDLSVVMVSKLVLKTAAELEHDFTLMDTNGHGFLDASEMSEAMAVYGAIADTDDSETSKKARAVNYERFVELVLPEIEKQIAQQLFALGVNMVSVMEQINTQKRADSTADSGSEDHGWAPTVTDGGGSDFTIPVGKSGFHIFISYRRTGLANARSVKQALEALGFRCFMDFEALNVGDFQENLEANLAGTPAVVVVLTPGALSTDARWPGGGRAPADGTIAIDWLQREVQLAQQMGKLIIPVRSSDFDIPAEFSGTPKDDINMLSMLNIVELNDDYFDASIDKIVTCIENRANMSSYVGDAEACDSPIPKGIGGGVHATAQ